MRRLCIGRWPSLLLVSMISAISNACDYHSCAHTGSLLTYYVNGVNGPCWPGYLPFIVIPEVSDESLLSGFTEDRYISGDEVATFIEVGGAYSPEGLLIGNLGPAHLFHVDTIHIDVTDKAACNPNYEITVQDVEEWICQHGPIPPRSFVIFNTGWSFKRGIRYYGKESAQSVGQLQLDSPLLGLSDLVGDSLIPGLSDFTWPGLSPKAAEFLLDSFPIIGVGIDTPSLDAGHNYALFPGEVADSRGVRRFLASYGLFLVQNLLLLDIQLPARGVFTTFGAFNMACATRAPVNVYAEWCVDRTPELRCQAADYRAVVFGAHRRK